MANELQEKLNAILEDKNTNLIPGNIKQGRRCLSVDGTLGITNTEQYQTCNRLCSKILDKDYIHRIPEEYELLDYIESTGTQYINSIELPNGNKKYSAEIIGQFTDLSYEIISKGADTDGSDWINPWHQIGVGSRGSGTNNKYFYFGYKQDSAGTNFYYSINQTKDYDTGVKADENIHSFYITKQRSVLGDEGPGFYIDGNVVGHEVGTINASTKYTYPFGLFGYENSNGLQCTKFRLYRMKLWSNGGLLCCMYPVKDKETGAIGLLDIYTANFYENEGTGEFLYKEL